MKNKRILFGICGSFYNHTAVLEQLTALYERSDVTAAVSENIYTCSTHFSDKDVFPEKVKDVTRRDTIHTVVEAGKVGPANACDITVIAPMTVTIVAKMAHGTYNHPVTLSTKAMVHNQRNIVSDTVTNDGLRISGVSILSLISMRHFYIIPFRQDAPFSKRRSTVSDWELMEQTVNQALNDRQLQPILLGGR